MGILGKTRLILFCFCIASVLPSVNAQTVRQPPARNTPPRVFLLDPQALEMNRQQIRRGDVAFREAVAKLDADALKAKSAGPFSVVSKDATPPSGDKHDYISQAPYFWPDPKTQTGLPYIRRDGERNPEINKYPDHQSMDRMIAAVETLAISYYFKGDEADAVHACRLLRAWFLDRATRMNPNLQYAQGIPGVTTGRGIGLIETRGLTRLIDAIGLLAGSRALTVADHQGLQDWFGKFLAWMLESKNGRDEAASRNNHGTYYDLQTASYALFLGKKELARTILEASRQKRLALQIEPDGSQPLELVRTKAWSYSVMNLQGLMSLARLGEVVGVDLWNYSTSDGRSIRRALDYLVPFALGDKKWPHQEIGEWPPQALFPLLRQAAITYEDPKYAALVLKIRRTSSADRDILLRRSAGRR